MRELEREGKQIRGEKKGRQRAEEGGGGGGGGQKENRCKVRQTKGKR